MTKFKQTNSLPEQFKIKVNPEQSEAIQLALFKEGKKWGGLVTNVMNTNSKYLYFDTFLTHEPKDKVFFKEYNLPKIKFSDYFEEDKETDNLHGLIDLLDGRIKINTSLIDEVKNKIDLIDKELKQIKAIEAAESISKMVEKTCNVIKDIQSLNKKEPEQIKVPKEIIDYYHKDTPKPETKETENKLPELNDYTYWLDLNILKSGELIKVERNHSDNYWYVLKNGWLTRYITDEQFKLLMNNSIHHGCEATSTKTSFSLTVKESLFDVTKETEKKPEPKEEDKYFDLSKLELRENITVIGEIFTNESSKEAGFCSNFFLQLRNSGEYENKGFYLIGSYNWQIVTDSQGCQVLLPTKK